MKTGTKYLALAALGVLVITVIRRTRTRIGAPGRNKTLKTRTIEAEAAFLQRLTPVKQFNLYLDGFHFESGHLGRQIRACHYCTMLSEDLTQCVIFDGTGPEARLIGVEYIVSEQLFRALPEEEKRLWHGHLYEVKSGELAAPGLPAWAELELMEKIKRSYGKIWHTWDTAQHKALPLGIPKLMMSFTEEGQLDPALLAERDRLLRISSAQNRERRAKLADEPMPDGADTWHQGDVVQVQLAQTGMSFRESD